MVTYKKLGLSILLPFVFLVISELSWANAAGKHPLYVGILSGMGSSTWDGLVPNWRKIDGVITSVPIHVSEGGGVWGGVLGYDFTPYFALEANYFHYPQAKVIFDQSLSLFSFNNGMKVGFKTETESYNLMAKIMLIIPNTQLRVYSSAGVGQVHRSDMLADDWRLSPSFGFGLNHQLAEHVMGELGANYTAGYGESQLNPTDTYFPFLYSVTMRLAYCF